jgi:small-conductance mechanosensitive channel|tara:strand:- start:38803 stop:40077 length:1275 start_codon:yes stop_codon:yes gene_type:complete
MNNPFDFLINNLNSDFLLSWSTICQIAIIFLAVGLASISNNSIRNYFISKTKESKEILVNGASRIISPIVTLIVLCISNSALNQYQPTNILSIAITLVNAMILIRLSIYLIRYIIKPSDSIKALESLISITVWVLVALHLFGVLSLFIIQLDGVTFNFGDHRFSLWLAIQVIFGVALSIFTAILFGQFIENRLMKVKELDMNARVMISKVMRIALYIIAIIVTLSSLGLNLTFLSVFGGAFGVGLAFGLQKIASNYISGFIILLDKSIHIGDILTIGEHYGVVTVIRSRYTILKMLDGIEVIIPNETLISENIINHTLSDRKSRVSVDVQISYKSSVDKAFEIMLNAAKNEVRVLNDPEPSVYLMKFADSGIDLMLSFYIVDPEEGSWELKSNVYREIWSEFQKHGIEIPYPHRMIEIINPETK